LNEAAAREQICLIGQMMHRNGLIDGASGNISARLDSERILTTPSGLAKGFMTPDQLIIIDMTGKRVDTPTPINGDLRPTSEVLMHLACYRERADVNGVVHAHPPTAIALTIAGVELSELPLPEVIILLGIVPTLPYATPASEDNQRAVETAIPHADALLLAYHGSLTVAGDVWDAYLRLENLEHAAQIILKTRQLGGRRTSFPIEQIDKLISIREKLGRLRPGEAERIRRVYAGVG